MTKKSLAYFSSSGSHKTLEGKISVTKDLTNELTNLVTAGLLKHRGIKPKAAAKYSKERALKI